MIGGDQFFKITPLSFDGFNTKRMTGAGIDNVSLSKKLRLSKYAAYMAAPSAILVEGFALLRL